jgi:hypothetical protein
MQTNKASNNQVDTKALRMGVVHWCQDDAGDGIISLLSNTLAELGCETINFFYDVKLPNKLDVVFVCGPFDSLVPLVNPLLAYSPSQRPLLVLWMTEQFPNPDLSEWVRYFGGMLRSKIERLAFREQSPGEWQLNPRLRWLTTKAYRYRYYGDLYWLQREGILSILAIASPWTADFLRERGFNPIVAYLGSHPSWGADLGLERDIPVLWIGKIGSNRRGRLLNRIREELRVRGVEMLVIDGLEHPYVFGEERTILLNRTKIALNLLRAKWDDNSMRYCLAAPNRALIVTEPTLPHTAFLPDKHLVEAPVEQIPDTICYYLSHEAERRQITEQAYQLSTTELTLSKGVAQILEQIALIRQNGGSG